MFLSIPFVNRLLSGPEWPNLRPSDGRLDMKSRKRFTTVLAIALAIMCMCSGCSALMPPTADNLRAQSEYQKIRNYPPQTDTSTPDCLWDLLYSALSIGGESLAQK
jgi:hypothetical protein